MIKLIRSVPEDLRALDLKDIFEHKDAIFYGEVLIGQGAPSYSLVDPNGEIIGIIGGQFIFPGVLEAFGLFSEKVKEHKLSFHKAALALLVRSFEMYKVHRIQILVRADYPQGNRWASVLGFEAEGRLRKYGPQEHDYIMYGKVK